MMKRILIRALFIGCLFASGLAQASIQEQLSHFHSMHAQFAQVATMPGGQKLESHGELWLVKPNQFRWAAKSPNKQLYVTDGKTLWTYEPDLEQATARPLPTKISETPLLLLSGDVSQLNNLFTVDQLSAQQYQLKPKKLGGLIKKVVVSFRDGKPSQLIICNQTGQVTRINFSQVVLNQPIVASYFHFKPPENTDVLR